nr:MFS transporter [Roseomonas sp. HF4]
MARDLSTSLPIVANLMAMTSITWGITSLIAGAGSDRWGRRPFLVGGPIGLALCMVGVALSGDYLGVAVAVTMAGAFAGGFTGVIIAERPPARRTGNAARHSAG